MSEKDKELLQPESINTELAKPDADDLIKDEELLFAYDDAENMLKDDRKQTDDILANFLDMVMNEGDGSTASKEAICKLLELKMKAADSIIKLADLKTRIKLKERNTFPPYMAQHNTYNIGKEGKLDKRKLLKELDKKKNEAKSNDKHN